MQKLSFIKLFPVRDIFAAQDDFPKFFAEIEKSSFGGRWLFRGPRILNKLRSVELAPPDAKPPSKRLVLVNSQLDANLVPAFAVWRKIDADGIRKTCVSACVNRDK